MQEALHTAETETSHASSMQPSASPTIASDPPLFVDTFGGSILRSLSGCFLENYRSVVDAPEFVSSIILESWSRAGRKGGHV